MSKHRRSIAIATTALMLLAACEPTGAQPFPEGAPSPIPTVSAWPFESPDDVKGEDALGRVGCVITGEQDDEVPVRRLHREGPVFMTVRVGVRVRCDASELGEEWALVTALREPGKTFPEWSGIVPARNVRVE